MSSPFRNLIQLIARELAKAFRQEMAEEPAADAYAVYTVDLAKPRDKERKPWGGDFLLVQEITGELDI